MLVCAFGLLRVCVLLLLSHQVRAFAVAFYTLFAEACHAWKAKGVSCGLWLLAVVRCDCDAVECGGCMRGVLVKHGTATERALKKLRIKKIQQRRRWVVVRERRPGRRGRPFEAREGEHPHRRSRHWTGELQLTPRPSRRSSTRRRIGSPSHFSTSIFLIFFCAT